MKRITGVVVLIVVSLTLLLSACGGKDEEPVVTPDPVIYKTDTATRSKDPQAIRPPVINITDTVSIKRMVLVMKDSAATSERIGIKMQNIYQNILPGIVKQQKLQVTGPRVAWYKTSSPPFFFEAGIPVNKKPAKMPKNVYIKNIGADSAAVAHFYGPYALTFQAYEALRDWMTSNKKKSLAPPFEVYIGEMYDSTGKPNDPYKVRTDIVFPHKRSNQ